MKLLLAIGNPWLRPAPDAPPDRQLLFGDSFSMQERKGNWVRGLALKDAYKGWVHASDLAKPAQLKDGEFEFQYVAVRSCWAYEQPDLKSKPLVDLHMTSTIVVTARQTGWLEILFRDQSAYVPATHCKPTQRMFDHPADAARAFLGTPYVWAGNTGFGLDCSGLVQVAMRACGLPCWADSHQQEARNKGRRLDDDEPLQSGDLLFWKGHVAMATAPDMMIHANAHHMAVVEEPTNEAIARIMKKEDRPVTTRLRPDLAPNS